jgi:hypothetical protein
MGAFFILPALMEVPGLRAGDPVVMRATPEALASVNWAFYEGAFRSFPWWNALEWAMLGLGCLGMWQARRDAGLLRRLCWAGLIGHAALAILARAPADVWALIPQGLRYVQYPQRLLGIAGLCLAVTIAGASGRFRTGGGQAVLAAMGVLIALYAAQLGRQVLPRSGETGAEVLHRLTTQYPDRGLTVVGEYLPRGTEPEALAESIRQTRNQLGSGPLLSWEKQGREYLAQIQLDSTGDVRLPLVNYSFYRVTSSGEPVEILTSPGQLTVRLPPGTHRLVIRRRWPWPSRAGLAVTLFSFGFWAWPARRRFGSPSTEVAGAPSGM